MDFKRLVELLPGGPDMVERQRAHQPRLSPHVTSAPFDAIATTKSVNRKPIEVVS
jgi:hypothetical protein